MIENKTEGSNNVGHKGIPSIESEFTDALFPEDINVLNSSNFDVSPAPYLEDGVPILHDYAPLRLPWISTHRVNKSQGVVVGTLPAKDLRDLAILPTILEAAKYTVLRRKQSFRDFDRNIIIDSTARITLQKAHFLDNR